MFSFHFQITSFVKCLRDCNKTIRQLLYVSKATPYLTELGKVIDLFKENFRGNSLKEQQLQKQVPPIKEENQTGQCKDLDAFSYVCQPLKGELLGHENDLDPLSDIKPIVHHDIPEIKNVTPLSCNQQPLSKAQDQTCEESILWNYGSMVPATDSAELRNIIQQLRMEVLSNGTRWQQFEFYACN
jgi:hypothetical protein